MHLCEVKNILTRQQSADQSDWNAYIDGVADYSFASTEQQALEFLSEFKIIDNLHNWKVNIAQSLGRYLPGTTTEIKGGKARTKGRAPKRVACRRKNDLTDIYDILCISPYLLDPLVHENISSLLFGHTPDALTRAPVSQNVLPNLTIVPPASSVRFVMASKTTNLFQAVPLLAGLIHLYASYLHYCDFSLVLQRLSCRLAMSGHKHHDEQNFDAQVHDLLLNDSSSGFLRRANGYSDFILKMALSSQMDEESQTSSTHMHGCITRVQKDEGDSTDTTSDTSGSDMPPSSKEPDHPVPIDQSATGKTAELEEILPPGEFELVGYGEHIDNSSVQQETKNLIGQLRLVSNSKALDFKIRGIGVRITCWCFRTTDVTSDDEHLETVQAAPANKVCVAEQC